MIGLIMCGGEGSRFITHEKIEKPLACVRGQTLIGRVLCAVILSRQFNRIVCVSSPHSPCTTELLERKYKTVDFIDVIVAEGLGYSRDLSNILNSLPGQKVLTFPSDLALLDIATVIKLVNQCTPSVQNTCTTIIAEKSFLKSIGLACSSGVVLDKTEYCYTGISSFYVSLSTHEKSFKENYTILNELPVVVNVNTTGDLGLAESLLDRFNQDYL
jgi:GTP:adenosylcobinamide-phosphate guanylyltransferase